MLGVGDDEVEEFLVEAWRRTGYWFTPAPELYKVRGEPEVYTTGSEALDNLLGGGVHTRSIKEFAGKYGVGKTQIAYIVLVNTLGERDVAAASSTVRRASQREGG